MLSHICKMPPAQDMCHICQMQCADQTENENKKLIVTAEQHLEKAKLQRDYYGKQVDSSNESLEKGTLNCQSYRYDHAQHCCSNPQQASPMSFKVPLKCGIFGVCNKGNRSQVKYLIDEVQTCKGANTVTSMVHLFLQHFAQNQGKISLRADNCVNQNKNNATTRFM